MLAALLVPHSERTLKDIVALVGERVQPAGVAFHLRKLLQITQSAVPLQILTELAFAIDTHDIPIDYARRRQIVGMTKLIDWRTWVRLAQKADARSGGARRVRFAYRYLYELLTGNNLHLAPAPYRIEGRYERIEYHDFVAGLPRALVDDLHAHALQLLDDAGISGEPLQWQPPASWITVGDWPGADPDLTDPEPIHGALCGLAGTTQPSSGVARHLDRAPALRHPSAPKTRPCLSDPTTPRGTEGRPPRPASPKVIRWIPNGCAMNT